MVSADHQARPATRERSRRRVLGVTISAGTLAVPIPLALNEFPDATQAPGASAIATGIVHDVPIAEEVYAAGVTSLVNRERTANGCAALTVNLAMTTAAYEHSRDMGVNGYFAHDTPSGETPWTRMENAGYAEPAAENIAAGYRTPQDVVAGWMNSPEHRENILNCSYKAAGVGYYDGPAAHGATTGSVGPWWTEDFGYE
jgi:uncharacterized protein YkwD